MSDLNVAVTLFAGVVIAFGLLYFLTVTVLGVRQTRKDGVPLAGQEQLIDADPVLDADTAGHHFFFLIPALNEELVIGATIEAILRGQAASSVFVVDDGSEDRTAQIVESYASSGRVVLVRRVDPHARQGKGKALNAGLQKIRAQVRAQNLPPSRVIVTVMDADGVMTTNATAAAAQEFAKDPSVGGLQLVVRIRNRDTPALEFQDMEFWAVSAIGQFGRVPFGSVSMGGNGQMTRLSALDEIGAEPWSESLTEDLDLGISLSVLGWRTTTTPKAYVTQQGVPDFQRLLRQRTRWHQGHMMAMARLPEMAASRHLPTGRFLELTMYLALPWCLALPWPVVQAYFGYQFVFGPGMPLASLNSLAGRALVALVWVALSFAPTVMWGVVYYLRARDQSFARSIALSFALVLWSYVTYIAAYRALGRILMQRHGWTKTARVTEGASAAPALAPAAKTARGRA